MDARKWSDLPVDLLRKIAGVLQSDRMDIRRLRAVCSSWRSSVPSPKKIPTTEFPFHMNHLGSEINIAHTLKERTLILVLPLNAGNDDSSDPPAPWIIQVEETSPNKLLLLDPIRAKSVPLSFDPPAELPDHISLSDHKLVEIGRSYDLHYKTGDVPLSLLGFLALSGSVRKAVVQRDSNEIDDEKFTLYALLMNGGLSYWKHGAERCNHLENKGYDETIIDIISHKEEVYVLYKGGRLMKIIKESYEMKEFVTKPLETGSYYGTCKLVEFEECLFLLTYDVSYIEVPVVDHKVFVLNKMNGSWDIANDLGGSAFFVSYDTVFSVSAKDVCLPEGSNVLHFEEAYYCYNSDTEDEEICSLMCSLHLVFTYINNWRPNRTPFWPPPKWIKQLNVIPISKES